MLTPTLTRIPRARILIERTAGSRNLSDYGRVDDASVTINGEPSITEDFDPINCVTYESRREYLNPSAELTAQLVDGQAKNVAHMLLSNNQTVAAAVGLTHTTSDSIAAGDLIILGWAPAGSTANNVFTPAPLTAAEDSAGTPATLTEGIDYEWWDARNGVIKILDVTGYTLPFVFTGDSRDAERAVLADALGVHRQVALIGVDQRNQCTGERIVLWKASIRAGTNAATLSQALTNDDGQTMTLTMDVTSDPSQAGDPVLGQFGYWERG